MNKEHRDYLQGELAVIEQWEKEQKDIFFWEKLGRLPFTLLDKITPKIVRDKLGDALNELGAFIQNGGRFLVKKKAVLRRIEKVTNEEASQDPSGEAKKSSVKSLFKQLSTAASSVTASVTGKGEKQEEAEDAQASITLEHVAQLPISMMDKAADEIISERVKFATASGAATGVGGFITMAADIPLVLGNSLKTLQEIAICYGFNLEEPMERVFVLKCLQFSSADIVGKKAILAELASFDKEHTNAEVISQIKGWSEVVATYRDNLGWKQLFQMIPIAGIVFGSISNKGTLSDVSEAGKMLYKKRRLLKRLSELE
ncbi:EcsC family protein [Neobacillus mesonae]|nr:EcsC family protein [Neobacillus mesonae]